MTQIINATFDRHIVHVSDRRLSRHGPAGGFTTFDRNSNKLVVVQARDSAATIAYTGRAFLDGVPSDRLLAEVAAGRSLGFTDFMASAGNNEPLADIGLISLRIADRLGTAWSRLAASEQAAPFEVLVSGWRWGGRIAVPFHWTIAKTWTVLGWQFKVQRQHRLFPSRDGFAVCAAPDIEPAVLSSLRTRLREVTSPRVEGTCKVLNDIMRTISDLRPGTVGKTYMQAIMCPWEEPTLRLRLVVAPEDSRADIPHGGFSPWIVLRSGVWAPSEIFARDSNSGWTCRSTKFSWSVEGVASAMGTNFFEQRPQRRPSEPRR